VFEDFQISFPFLCFPSLVLRRQDIANEAFKRKVSQQEEKSLKSKLEKSTQSSAVYVVADILFSLVMDMLFMLQSAVVGFIPVIGYPLSLVHQVLLISLYAFEYRCYSEGLANCKYRIHIVEGNLVYFLGFGAPLAAVMLYPSSYIVSTCCFALLFPVTIVSAYEARHIDFLSSAPRSTFKFPVFNLSAKLANEVTTFLLRCLLGLRTSSTKKTVTLKTN
jgi:etoposide-induced 2.4 mRNA